MEEKIQKAIVDFLLVRSINLVENKVFKSKLDEFYTVEISGSGAENSIPVKGKPLEYRVVLIHVVGCLEHKLSRHHTEYSNSKVRIQDVLETMLLNCYKELERMSKSISVGYEMYRSVIADNVKLQDKLDAAGEKNEELMKEIDLLKFHLRGADEASKLLAEQNKELYQKFHNEKMAHTYTKARIVYAEHILNGNRDQHVKDFIDKKQK